MPLPHHTGLSAVQAETPLPARFAVAEVKQKMSHEPRGWFWWLRFDRQLWGLASARQKMRFLCAPTHIFEFQEFIRDSSLFYGLDW